MNEEHDVPGEFGRAAPPPAGPTPDEVGWAARAAMIKIARIEGWTSAPKREEYYMAGFRAGVAWFMEELAREVPPDTGGG